MVSDFALLLFVFKAMPRHGSHCSERVNTIIDSDCLFFCQTGAKVKMQGLIL